MKEINAAFFDVGGPLIRTTPSPGEIYCRIASSFGISCDPEKVGSYFWDVWEEQSSVIHPGKLRYGTTEEESKKWWWPIVRETLFRSSGEEPSIECFEAIFQAFAEAKVWKVYDDVLPCLKRLCSLNLRLGIISNWDLRLRGILGGLDLEKYFEVIIISSEVGVEKPDPEIFRIATGKLEVNPETSMHVGDSISEDVAGAEGAGIKGVLLERGGEGDETGIQCIASLKDLSF